MKLLFLCSLILACGLSAIAQISKPAENVDTCQQYKMRVQEAPAELDQQMLLKENLSSNLARGQVIDPCANQRRVPVRGLRLTGKPMTPLLKTANPMQKEVAPKVQPLKPPSEMLRPKMQLVIPQKKQ